ncbi:MAG: hypothetical protein K2N51_01310 [Lachnospiraceae bacterium]|nr:hypothetical protein [Lachnospiraceae bacterium]
MKKKKVNIQKIIWFCIVGILAVAVFMTGQYGLSEKNLSIYASAVGMQESMEQLGFKDFVITDYPITFFDGNTDYVVEKNGDECKVTKRKPVLPTFVGTAYEVILPTIEKFEEMFSMLDTVENIQTFDQSSNFSFQESEYGENEQIATLWHEGFHAWQMSKFENEIENILEGHTFSEQDFHEGRIVKEIDKNSRVVNLYQQELKLLKHAVLSEDIDSVKQFVIKYRKLDEERKKIGFQRSSYT